MITKTVRLTGGSPDSIEDSVNGVLGRAAETLSDIQSFRVVEVGGTVDSSGAPSEYTVTLDITFVVKESTTHR
ncbi:MAG: dodecin family protein [Acidimicrobiia bacterium]|jgi:flavin-binding protein dodecin|nr:dodecin family protein [Acidimicrobiia bacterium]